MTTRPSPDTADSWPSPSPARPPHATGAPETSQPAHFRSPQPSCHSKLYHNLTAAAPHSMLGAVVPARGLTNGTTQWRASKRTLGHDVTCPSAGHPRQGVGYRHRAGAASRRGRHHHRLSQSRQPREEGHDRPRATPLPTGKADRRTGRKHGRPAGENKLVSKEEEQGGDGAGGRRREAGGRARGRLQDRLHLGSTSHSPRTRVCGCAAGTAVEEGQPRDGAAWCVRALIHDTCAVSCNCSHMSGTQSDIDVITPEVSTHDVQVFLVF